MSTSVTDRPTRLVIVGNPGEIHVGAHFLAAARCLGVAATICNTDAAFAAPWAQAKISWWLCGHQPPRLRAFSQYVVETCRSHSANVVLATGLAPLDTQGLQALGRMGVARINFLTDDPWNPAHRAPWFLKALAHYDYIFSPRRANLDDLRRLGGPTVTYLPFAYNPALHYAEPSLDETERRRFDCDVLFAGGADQDRVPLIAALIDAGFRVALYGGYWQRFAVTRAYARGHADIATLRKAVAGARVALCLVRRANRDGHVMRSFETPAMGGCLLLEDTGEHRALFGSDDTTARYFDTPTQMTEQARELIARPDVRARLADAARATITRGAHTYRDRLAEIWGVVQGQSVHARGPL